MASTEEIVGCLKGLQELIQLFDRATHSIHFLFCRRGKSLFLNHLVAIKEMLNMIFLKHMWFLQEVSQNEDTPKLKQ